MLQRAIFPVMPGELSCDGTRAGEPHGPVALVVKIGRWTDCPSCRARYVADQRAHPDYAIVTPRDQFGPPEFLEIEPIHTCNLRCVMCHVSYQPVSKVRIDPGFVDKVEGMEGKWAVIGSEYEPMAHPQIVQIIRGLSDRGMKIDLTSNGTLFTERVTDALATCNFRRVTISFDGVTKNTFEAIRHRANYETALRRILNFKKRVLEHNPSCHFSVNYTVIRDNIDEMADAATFWELHGFDHLGFIAMVVRADTEYLHEQSIERHLDRFQAQIDEASRRVVAGRYRLSITNSLGIQPLFANEIAGNVFLGLVMSDDPGAKPCYSPRPFFQNYAFPGVPVACASPYKALKLQYDGSLQVCSKFTIGHIEQEGSLLDIWRGFMAQKIRAAIGRNPKICYTCDYYRFCIRAGSIDPTVSENFESAGSPEPHMIAHIMGHPMVEWAGEYYLLHEGVDRFDPRFDEIEPVVMFRSAGFADMLVSLSRELAKSAPTEIGQPCGRHRFWQIGTWFMAAPREGYDGETLRVASLDELRFGRDLHEVLDTLGYVPKLVDSFNSYNIVHYEQRYIGVPQAAGPVNVDTADLSSIPAILIAGTLDDVKRQIGELVTA